MVRRCESWCDFDRNDELNCAVSNSLESKLYHHVSSDLKRIGARLWCSPPSCHIRNLFEFQAMKGSRFSARWGVSIDFVPKLKNKKLVWKKSEQDALLDLCIDPIDMAGSIPQWCSIEVSDSDRHIANVVSEAVKAAQGDWRKLTSLQGIVDWFETSSKMTFQRFSPHNYTQTHLCWGLTLIALDQQDQGQNHLRNFCAEFNVSPIDPILVEAITEAKSTRST
jgi:hypothetical protein